MFYLIILICFLGVSVQDRALTKKMKQIQDSISHTDNEQAIVKTAARFRNWCALRGESQVFPVDAKLLSAYLVSRCSDLKGSSKSLMVWVRQLKTYSLINRYPWMDPADDRAVLKIIRFLEAADLAPTRRAAPLLQEILIAILNCKVIPDLTKLVCAVGHDGLLRGGEICSGLKVSDHCWSSSRKSVTIELRRTKVHRRGGSQFVTLRDYGPLSAVRALKRHFDLYNLWLRPNSFVYPAYSRGSLEWNKSLSTSQLRRLIKNATGKVGLNSKEFSNHSLRAGGATDLFRCGVYYPTIKKFGRWKSDCALIYYRDDEGVSDAVCKGFGKLAKRNTVHAITRSSQDSL
jgi:hypothetical protein